MVRSFAEAMGLSFWENGAIAQSAIHYGGLMPLFEPSQDLDNPEEQVIRRAKYETIKRRLEELRG